MENTNEEIIMSTLTFSPERVFNSAATGCITATKLSETTALIAYRDNSNHGTAVLATISGTSISFSIEYIFNTESTWEITATKLSETQVLIVYRDEGSCNHGTAVLATISGSTITYSPEYVFNTVETWNITATALSPTTALIVYEDREGNSLYGTALLATISGNSISYSAEHVFNTAGTYYTTVTALSPTQALIAYTDSGTSSDHGTAVIATISGNSISYSPKHVFNAANTQYISATALSETTALIAYTDSGTSSDHGTAVLATISGTSISFSSEHVFNAASTYSISVTALSETTALIAYRDNGNSYHGTTVLATISGGAITYSAEHVFNAASTYSISVTALSETTALIAYRDAGNSSHGTAVLATISGE